MSELKVGDVYWLPKRAWEQVDDLVVVREVHATSVRARYILHPLTGYLTTSHKDFLETHRKASKEDVRRLIEETSDKLRNEHSYRVSRLTQKMRKRIAKLELLLAIR